MKCQRLLCSYNTKKEKTNLADAKRNFKEIVKDILITAHAQNTPNTRCQSADAISEYNFKCLHFPIWKSELHGN